MILQHDTAVVHEFRNGDQFGWIYAFSQPALNRGSGLVETEDGGRENAESTQRNASRHMRGCYVNASSSCAALDCVRFLAVPLTVHCVDIIRVNTNYVNCSPVLPLLSELLTSSLHPTAEHYPLLPLPPTHSHTLSLRLCIAGSRERRLPPKRRQHSGGPHGYVVLGKYRYVAIVLLGYLPIRSGQLRALPVLFRERDKPWTSHASPGAASEDGPAPGLFRLITSPFDKSSPS